MNTLIQPAISNMFDQASMYFSLLNHSYYRGLDLFRRALEAGQSRTYSEAQMRMLDLWQASLDALQSNTRELTRINSQMMTNWSDVAERTAAQGAEAVHSSAQAASQGAKAQSADRPEARAAHSGARSRTSTQGKQARGAQARAKKRK